MKYRTILFRIFIALVLIPAQAMAASPPVTGFFRDYVKDKENDALLRGVAWTPPATIYLGLASSPAARIPGSTFDITGAGYARVAVPGASWNASSAGLITNSATISFPAATGAWAKAYSVFAVDAASGAEGVSIHILWMANLVPDSSGDGVTVASGKTLSFAPGAISIQR